MMRKVDLFYTFLHVPVDFVAIWAAFFVAYYLRGNGLEIYRLPLDDYVRLTYVAVPIWIIVYALQGLYSRVHLFGTLQNLSQIAISSLSGWASFILFLVFSKTETILIFPRLMLIYILILSIALVFSGRLLLRFLQYAGRLAGYGRLRVAILGQGELADEMENSIINTNDPAMIFTGRLTSVTPKDVANEMRVKKINELIIADTKLSSDKAFEYLLTAQNSGVMCHFVPNMFDVQASNVVFTTVAGIPMLTFRQTPLEGWGRIAKRLFDIVVSGVALVALSPIFLILCAIIAVTDPGPIVYSHIRLGRDSRPFEMFKFRSMITKYCAGPDFSGKTELEIFADMKRSDLIAEFKRDHKVKNDPRISIIGKFMRKARLDELPQLWNVLRGDLSLVGPRPIVTAELEKYGRWASYLLSIKPGMTGLWQVSGGNDIGYGERVQLDAHYVQNWSLWQDMVIIVKTFLTLLRGKNAY